MICNVIVLVPWRRQTVGPCHSERQRAMDRHLQNSHRDEPLIHAMIVGHECSKERLLELTQARRRERLGGDSSVLPLRRRS